MLSNKKAKLSFHLYCILCSSLKHKLSSVSQCFLRSLHYLMYQYDIGAVANRRSISSYPYFQKHAEVNFKNELTESQEQGQK